MPGLSKSTFARKGSTPSYRAAPKKSNSAKWRHKAYRGWINLERGLSEIVLAEIHAQGSGNPDSLPLTLARARAKSA